MKTFRWAFIGTGKIAKKAAAQITNGNHIITEIYSRTYQNTVAFAEAFGGHACFSLEEMFERDDFDAVYICTPHTSHAQYAIYSIKRKKPVLCEKPLGINEQEVKNIIDYALKNKVYAAEGMWTWFCPTALKVRQWVENGTLGEIKQVQAHYSFPAFEWLEGNSRVLSSDQAGGCLLDIGIYAVDYCYKLFGKPVKIICDGLVENGIDVREKIQLFYSGFSCDLHISLFDKSEDFLIYGTEGEIILPRFRAATDLFIDSKNLIDHYTGTTDLITEFDMVALEIINGKLESEYMSLTDSLLCICILDECRRQMNLVYSMDLC